MEALVTVTVKRGLPPIAPADARLIVLGSLPGDASLTAGRYYAHPTNQFWRLIGLVTHEPLAELPYDARLARLAAHGIGLWDVIGEAERPGSLDQAIRAPRHNPLTDWVNEFPDLRAIAFNGQAASVAGWRLLANRGLVELIDLPSSSAANTARLEEKAERWLQLRAYLD